MVHFSTSFDDTGAKKIAGGQFQVDAQFDRVQRVGSVPGVLVMTFDDVNGIIALDLIAWLASGILTKTLAARGWKMSETIKTRLFSGSMLIYQRVIALFQVNDMNN